MSTESTARGTSAADLLSWSRDLVDSDLRAAVDRLPFGLRLISGYHFGWWDADGKSTDGNAGKAVRPALVLLSAEAVGGTGSDAVPAAVAVELLHNHTLLHDDVIDADRLRRHRPTAWSVFGIPQAILAGDALSSLANEFLSGVDVSWSVTGVRWLNEAMIELCDGQLADVAFERRGEVDLASCVRMAEGKTAALAGVSCALGALSAGADGDRIELLRRFGRHLGLAFQLVDDLLGISGDPAATGKPVGADLARRKKSLPVVAAMASGSAAGDELKSIYAAEGPVDVARAGELVVLAGGVDWARSRAGEEMNAAITCLDAADCVPAARTSLVGLSDLLLRRDH